MQIYSSGELLRQKLLRLHWPVLLAAVGLALTGVLLQYDAAGGSMAPWAGPQLVRLALAVGVMLVVAVCDVRVLYQLAYLFYAVCVLLLLYVEFEGYIGMGAQRWISLGFMTLQPSELAKVGTAMALAAYMHKRSMVALHSAKGLLGLVGMIAAPMVLTLLQPDLGTALIIVMVGTAVVFLGGLSWRIFAGVGALIAAAVPVMWLFVMHDYQKRRVLTFLNPETDLAGAGYHVHQSNIAIGSGGFWGKGFLQGSQSHLQFLPEKHTDFIFSLFVEEFGMAGALAMMAAFCVVIFFGLLIALRAQSRFSTLLAGGVVAMIFCHTAINMAMVMGLMPVVGVPLPFVSYGGTSLLNMMFAVGLVLNAHIHRDVMLHGRAGLSDRKF